MQYINSGFNVTTIKYPYLWTIRALWDYERKNKILAVFLSKFLL